MSLRKYDWNVVLLGHWNRAILTPRGIARRLFELEDGIQIQVELPIDGLEPIKVTHDDVTVRVASNKITFDACVPTIKCMKLVLEIAIRALKALPETPVHAAGVNFRVETQKLDGEFPQVIQCPIDGISDLGFKVVSSEASRRIVFNQGVLNLQGAIDSDSLLHILFNFHKDADDPANSEPLIEWLGQDITVFENCISELLRSVVDETFEETAHEELS